MLSKNNRDDGAVAGFKWHGCCSLRTSLVCPTSASAVCDANISHTVNSVSVLHAGNSVSVLHADYACTVPKFNEGLLTTIQNFGNAKGGRNAIQRLRKRIILFSRSNVLVCAVSCRFGRMIMCTAPSKIIACLHLHVHRSLIKRAWNSPVCTMKRKTPYC
jgi:hypothetical protein